MNKISKIAIESEIKKHADKLRQFDIVSLTEIVDIELKIKETCFNLGVWGMKNPHSLMTALSEGLEFNVVIGFRPSRFHIGHLTLAQELAYLINAGAKPHFVVSGHAEGQNLSLQEARAKVDEFLRYVKKLYPEINLENYTVFSDTASGEILDLERDAEKVLKLKKILQLYGWGTEISLQSLRQVTSSVAAYLIASKLDRKRSSVVLVDANQVAHVEASTIVAKRLDISVPTFSFRTLVPSLLDVDKRMSGKEPRSVIYLDEIDNIVKKLGKSVSGGRETPELQNEMGGQIEKCAFARIAGSILAPRVSNQMHLACVSGQILCGDCKRSFGNKVKEKLSS